MTAVLYGIQIYFGSLHWAFMTAKAITLLIAVYFYGVAQYSGRHYRLTRTHWRGINGYMAGSPWRYGWTFFWTRFFIIITLGWAWPWAANKLQKKLTEDTRIGNLPLQYHGYAGPLYKSFSALWMGANLLTYIFVELTKLRAWEKDFRLTQLNLSHTIGAELNLYLSQFFETLIKLFPLIYFFVVIYLISWCYSRAC